MRWHKNEGKGNASNRISEANVCRMWANTQRAMGERQIVNRGKERNTRSNGKEKREREKDIASQLASQLKWSSFFAAPHCRRKFNEKANK